VFCVPAIIRQIQRSCFAFWPFARCLSGPRLIARFFASMARVLAGRLTNIAFNATTLNVAERIAADLSEQPVKKSPA
jgi:hypothetical protein